MAVAALFEFPNESIDKYEKVLEQDGVLDQPKRVSHVCYVTDNGFAVVDVWEDEASFAAFGDIIGPALQNAGLDGKPAVYPVHGTISQEGRRGR